VVVGGGVRAGVDGGRVWHLVSGVMVQQGVVVVLGGVRWSSPSPRDGCVLAALRCGCAAPFGCGCDDGVSSLFSVLAVLKGVVSRAARVSNACGGRGERKSGGIDAGISEFPTSVDGENYFGPGTS